MNRLLISLALVLSSCGRDEPRTTTQSTLVLRATKSWLVPLTEAMARMRGRRAYKTQHWQQLARGKHSPYEVRGRKWFTSSLSGKFALSRMGQVHGVTRSTFGKFSAYSDLGSGLKYDVNQDGYALFHTPRRVVLAVFDGISTGGNGETATEVAINTLRDELPRQSLWDALLQVRKNLHEHALADLSVSRKYGVVAAGADIRGNTAYIAHVGDARLLHLRDGKVWFETRDHNPTWDKVRDGLLSPERYVQDDVNKSLVEKSLRIPKNGDYGNKTVEMTIRHLNQGDTLIVASDAVWNLFTNDEIVALTAGRSTQEAVLSVRKAVKERVGNIKKRDDNFTIAVYHHDPQGLLQ